MRYRQGIAALLAATVAIASTSAAAQDHAPPREGTQPDTLTASKPESAGATPRDRVLPTKRWSGATPRVAMSMMTVSVGADTSSTAEKPPSPLGGYTRLLMTFEPDDSVVADRDYDDEARSGWARYLLGKSTARLFSVKATLSRPHAAFLTTLASASHDSNQRVGEAWVTEINSQRTLTPYFRIDADTAVALETTLSVTQSFDASTLNSLLNVLKRAVQVAAPASTLVTSLNEDRYQQVTQFADSSIASLLNESIVERASNDFRMTSWGGRLLLAVDLRLPMGNYIKPGKRARGKGAVMPPIGRWIVSSEPPILSIFSDRPLERIDKRRPPDVPSYPAQISPRSGERNKPDASFDAEKDLSCDDPAIRDEQACLAFRGIDPQTILNFSVGADVSVAQALAGEPAITTARDMLVISKSKDAARQLCTLIAGTVHRLGFNRLDMSAVLWAYASQTFADPAARKAFADPENCSLLNVAYGVGLPRFAVTVPEELPRQIAPTIPASSALSVQPTPVTIPPVPPVPAPGGTQAIVPAGGN